MAGSKTILFIEDDPFILDMYTRALEKSGYDVEHARTGSEAIDVLDKRTFELIILDIMIPEKLGMQVLKELRSHPNKDVAKSIVVILTNYAHDKETRQQLEEEADAYLIKAETTPKELVKIIDKFIG